MPESRHVDRVEGGSVFDALDDEKGGFTGKPGLGSFMVRDLGKCAFEFLVSDEKLFKPGIPRSVERMLARAGELVEGLSLIASELIMPALGEYGVGKPRPSAMRGHFGIKDDLLVHLPSVWLDLGTRIIVKEFGKMLDFGPFYHGFDS